MDTPNTEKMREMAIEAVLSGNFDEAIRLNQELLEILPDDVDVHMQLAHAFWQTGDLQKAQKYYRKTLTFEPNNILAKKKLTLLKPLTKKQDIARNRKRGKTVHITDLIDEPGKTKTVRLSHIGKPEHLSLLNIGEEVFINIRRRKIEVRDISGNFIGYLPDDISKRLIEFIKSKNKYEAFIFSIDRNEVKIFIREVKRGRKYKNIATFSSDELIPHNPADEEEQEETAQNKKTTQDEELDIDDDELVISPEDHLNQEEKEEEDEEEEEDEDEYDEYEK